MKTVNLEPLFADKKKLALAAVCLCAAVYADVALVISWQARSLGDARSRAAKAKAEIASVTRDMALMSQKADEKAVRIHNQNNIPEILRYISALAADHDIRIMQITPKKSGDAKSSYLSLGIKLDLMGGYHDLGMFLCELERNEHPLFPEDLKISQSEDFQKQRVSLTLRTYVKK